ncbi:hypothetical protein Pst134EA_027775 [Puccinia striiformis f. sp. tritici]|uniref:hypothetical protein n=1 Tax=Puccinia striiformis f. sp. tritici TaxID=168172 RepID=UPI002007375D|nr:hypothetical protein Pst134EA_027775 [Puccinia striiformis f. sp. tritici]KAH9448465.1 hypothetical protein Pst134EA_027775 [Puccinia striiformis f. sp. tritici]
MDPKLNDLLHWAVENTNTPATQSQTRSSTAIGPVVSSDPTPLTITYNPHQPSQASVPSTHKKLDTGVLDAILGRTDAVRMREAISIFEDPKKSIHERCNAGEELEDLIQDLDNANDMEVLGIWPKLMTLMESNTSGGNSKDDDLIKFHACWICGTAVQNNPKSQTAFLKKRTITCDFRDIKSRIRGNTSKSDVLFEFDIEACTLGDGSDPEVLGSSWMGSIT